MTLVVWSARLLPVVLCVLFKKLEGKILYNLSSSRVVLHDIAFRFVILIAGVLSLFCQTRNGAGSFFTTVFMIPWAFFLVGQLWSRKKPFLCVDKNSDQFRYQAVSGKVFRFNMGYDNPLYDQVQTIPQYEGTVDCFVLHHLKPSFEKLYSRILSSEPEEVIPEISYTIRTYPKELSDRISECACGNEKTERLAQMLRDSVGSAE